MSDCSPECASTCGKLGQVEFSGNKPNCPTAGVLPKRQETKTAPLLLVRNFEGTQLNHPIAFLGEHLPVHSHSNLRNKLGVQFLGVGTSARFILEMVRPDKNISSEAGELRGH